MFEKYEVVESIKTLNTDELSEPSNLYQPSTWYRVRDMATDMLLPGGFDTYEAAQAFCAQMNADRV